MLLLLCCAAGFQPAAGAAVLPVQQQVAERACNAIARYVGAPSGPPVFLQSYVTRDGDAEPSLKTAAFTYDNALAVIALVACDKLPQAIRVGEALRRAATTGARLQNAYRAGPVEGDVLPNGWWDPKTNRWLEDPHQSGTSTGNVAWAALALLALDRATGEPRWREAAEHLATWITDNAWSAGGVPGFAGGLEGFDPRPDKLTWKSTEHNIDAAALFEWLARDSKSSQWERAAREARHFVDMQWDARTGHFFAGTLPDGGENRGASVLDVQMWANLLPNPQAEWRRAVRYAEKDIGVAGGFDFNTDRDGLWLEGTAQAALVYGTLGERAKADELFTTISGQFAAASGYVYATREARITTGLSLGPHSSTADFYYFHRPHLGATAWAALAALAWNPFVAHPRERSSASTVGRFKERSDGAGVARGAGSGLRP
ncbi:MAG TPA: hypothetical protein VJ862_15440 [Rhodanobacteraceae bacterium]|nr:hypothetical protein [Rhodanobacteraceae bacterium]